MGLLAVLKLMPIDLPELVTETERSGGGKGDKDKTPAPKVAQVAVEPEIEKTGSKSGEDSPTTTDTAPAKTGGVGPSRPCPKLAPCRTPQKKTALACRRRTRNRADQLPATANGAAATRFAATALPSSSSFNRASTRSRNSLPALKCGTYFSGTCTFSPDFGLRPTRGGR